MTIAQLPISVLVITLNEQENISACLASLSRCDEIVVVDSGSSDATREIVRAAGATVVEHAFQGYADQKNWAIRSIPWRNDWLLFVDADERLTRELEAAIGDAMRVSSGADAYYVDRQFHFLGHTFRHSGLRPNWHLRLVRRSVACFEERTVDERLIPPQRTRRLSGALVHRDQRGLTAWIDRHNHYSDLDSVLRMRDRLDDGLNLSVRRALTDPALRRRWLKRHVWPHIPGKPAAIFVYMYVVRGGFRDGRAGWQYAWLRAFYEFITGLKIAERYGPDGQAK